MCPDFQAGEPAAEISYGGDRRGPDRRARPTPRLSRFTFWGGQRRDFRRSEEGVDAFVDRYPNWMLGLLAWIALMNLADSFFTLVHLQAGGIELNPFAAMLLETGRLGFVLWKAVLIGGAVLVLCMHKNFALARVGLGLAAAAYTALVIYHLTLF
ncbi:MAG: DUF5658 family protein [Planctomycetota bacterium]|nr:DUF5658 family protein [Planctomycetota bacterium]